MSGSLDLGPVDQVSYVVADLDSAMPHYEALYGAFRTGDAKLPGCTIRGFEAACHLRIAVNNESPIEIELIQVLEGDTPHSEHLRAHGEGLHHVRFRVRGIDAKLEELERAGYRNVFFKRFGPDAAFAYLEAPSAMGGSLIELLELPA